MLKNYELRSELLRKCAVIKFLKDQNCNKKCVVVKFLKNQNCNKKCVVVESSKDQKSLLYVKSFRLKIFIKFIVNKHSQCRRWTKNYNHCH